MQTRELPEEAPGKYVPYHPEPYYSPEPLPVEPRIDIPDETYHLAIDAAREIGRVDGVSKTVDFSAALYASVIRVEAVESARIEGADVEYQDIEAYHTQRTNRGGDEPAIEKDLQEAVNYEDALTHALEVVGSRDDITLELIKDLHGTLLSGVRNEGDVVGDFRDHMVNIKSPIGGQRPYVPPTPEAIAGLMESLESYIQSDGDYHPLINSAVIHYFFEAVHPFSDGNGRLGRLLIIVYLASEGYVESSYIYPSSYFNKNKFDYVRRMRSVSEEGKWDDWIQFFIEGLRTQAVASWERTWELRDLQTRYENEYPGKSSADRMARALLQKPYFAPPELTDFLDVSKPTVYRVVDELEERGLIEEVTGKQSGKQYKAVDVFDILQ